VAVQRGFGEFDDVLVTIGERAFDRRFGIRLARRDFRDDTGAAVKAGVNAASSGSYEETRTRKRA
jgi:hypothetical protein